MNSIEREMRQPFFSEKYGISASVSAQTARKVRIPSSTSSPSASSRLQSCFACALALADFISTKSIVFLSFRTGPKRTLGPGPLRNLQAPEARSPPLDSTLTPSGLTSCIALQPCSISAKLCHFRITGAAPSQSSCMF